ncbi:MAG TPA: ferredoxin [Steroidobacteraceae bacterium]|nr:ferredoxin [Steroidobacteraceae bacterium]
MDSQLRSQVLFHLTGRRVEADTAAALPPGLRPALMAPYRRLDALRHDFPIVLAEGEGEYVVGLSAAVDGALRAVAPPGTAGESMRRRALGVERVIRRRVIAGQSGTLSQHWDAAIDELAAPATDGAFRKEMGRVREALPLDGQLVGCDAPLPSTFVQHAWRVVQREKCRVARARIDRLVQRLEAIVRADEARSPEAHTPARLQETFGAAHRDLFDFAAMSRLLSQPRPRGGLPDARRRRIAEVLEVLRSQWLFPAAGEAGFACASTGEALDEFLRRLPAMVALHKALQVGELEADGRYVEEIHDPVFAAIDECSLSAEDLRAFPDLLVCARATAPGSNAALIEALATGVPLKVLVELDDVLEQSASFGPSLGFGLRESQLATSAMSLGETFVLQTVASNLLQMRDQVQRGLRHAGAALFSVYVGPPVTAGSLPTFLVTAAALQSRAFPTFCYDPRAGADLATRFSLAGNPQPESDWPEETFSYADADLQSVSEPIPFTFLDFALCDPRLASHFAVVPRARWGDGFVPAARWLAEPPADVSTALPYLLAVDEADLLCRLVVDERLARAALRCREGWRRLQELGGVRDSRLERAVARERERWQAELERELAARAPAPAAAPAPVAPSDTGGPAAPGAVEEPPHNPDEPSVETLRCSSCNECTLAFPKIFAYNDEKQAYLKDPRAGTYRQLVEAAEACQVSVIHPGKPWDPHEPGLEELLERAKPFL